MLVRFHSDNDSDLVRLCNDNIWKQRYASYQSISLTLVKK
jgi:hypothetical protein